MRTVFNKNVSAKAAGTTINARGNLYSRRKNQSHAEQKINISPTPSRPEQGAAITTRESACVESQAHGISSKIRKKGP